MTLRQYRLKFVQGYVIDALTPDTERDRSESAGKRLGGHDCPVD